MWGRSGGRYWDALSDSGCGQPITRPSSVSPGLTPDQKWDKVHVRDGIKARTAVGQLGGGQLPELRTEWGTTPEIHLSSTEDEYVVSTETSSVIHWRTSKIG